MVNMNVLHTLIAAMVASMILGCESVALVGRPTLPPGGGLEESELIGRIDGVDLNRQLILIRTSDGGERSINYNARTRALIQGRDYPVTSLRVGDQVALQVLHDERGNTYTELVRVRSVPAMASELPASELLEGGVERINRDLGYLEVRPRSGELTRAYLPYHPTPTTEQIFRRLQIGDFVRVEGNFIDDRRFEIQNFL